MTSIEHNFNKSYITSDDRYLIKIQNSQYSSFLIKKQKELNIYTILFRIMKVINFYKLTKLIKMILIFITIVVKEMKINR